MLFNKPFSALLGVVSTLALLSSVAAFPSYGSLAGLSEKELDDIIPRLSGVMPGKPPVPLKLNGTKLVNDRAHPWKPLRKNDIRGPCPGLNTLASHGYLPRDGVATPAQIIQAVQEGMSVVHLHGQPTHVVFHPGFNMENQVARFTTYAAFLVDGNLVTDLLSIGGKTQKTGPDPAKPASVAGLNTHAVFEGDASMTRADEFFGDNHSLNETLWQQFVEYSNTYGAGYYNKTVATELRWRRIQESITTNPEFDFTSPRFFTAYAESTFPFVFFVDGRTPTVNGESKGVHVTNATFFFKESKFPPDFHRPAEPSGPTGASDIFNAHPIAAGKNMNGINSYTADPTSADFSNFCLLYTNFVNKTIKGLYPNPKGILKRNLIINLRNLFDGMDGRDCEEVFPYGKL